ncbi:hypothetical protein N0V93_009952 [Gnomoniopsis smithogilvyi]|uniref:MOSC domain-containing protein n=1 Tax=Gnomoniopsis smithogilvyi TaxID=1191159 RepID=A0A9W9CRW4_9PEZI|nr:hypothetical protein N0V93_009952 [Gnomoniopsis smithogilvyi]
MKVTQLYVYPIKSLRGIALQHAKLDRQGVQYDRKFMLLKAQDDGNYESVEVVKFPACALFIQEIVDGKIVVRYKIPEEPLFPPTSEQKTTIEIPLEPDISGLDTVEVDLYKSKGFGYRMPDAYSSWFSSCLGFETVLVYIGDAKRPVLGTLSPYARQQQNQGWFSSIKSYLTGAEDPHWLTFTCVAAYLIATEASTEDVSRRLPPGEKMDVRKFRPNIVIDGEEPFDEDFWGEIVVHNRDSPRFTLTGNCGRCVSINVDYKTGRRGTGQSGNVLKTMMRDRRVDLGNKWSPIFGRYGFLENEEAEIWVGDEVTVTKRLDERCVWDWPPYK